MVFNRKALNILSIVLAVLFVLSLGLYIFQEFYFRLPGFRRNAEKETEETSGNNYEFETDDQFDILLLGLDTRSDKDIGSRTDTMILASIDPVEKTCKLLSIPRDTRVKYKNSWMKINAAFYYDQAEGSMTAVSDLLGIEVDRYAIIDFQGVTDLVDLVDGVYVDVPFKMKNSSENIDLEPGHQKLNGTQALGYMRYRDSIHSDFERSERQKEVMKLVAQKLLTSLDLSNVFDMYSMAKKYVETNVTIAEIGALVKIAPDILANGIESQTMPGEGGMIGSEWCYIAHTSQMGLPENEAEAWLRENGWTVNEKTPEEEEPLEEEPVEEENPEGSGAIDEDPIEEEPVEEEIEEREEPIELFIQDEEIY